MAYGSEGAADVKWTDVISKLSENTFEMFDQRFQGEWLEHSRTTPARARASLGSHQCHVDFQQPFVPEPSTSALVEK